MDADSTAALNSNNVNNPDSVSDLQQFILNTLAESQIADYETIEKMQNNFSICGNITDAVQLSYLSSQYGMDTNAVNLSGIANLNAYAVNIINLSVSNSALSEYQNKEKSVGNVLDCTA